jgi:mono/diheme cytochrome c family protein
MTCAWELLYIERWLTAPMMQEDEGNGDPTYKVAQDGTVDWYLYSGFRRYHSECHVCHGPDGEGSTYAPALKNKPSATPSSTESLSAANRISAPATRR